MRAYCFFSVHEKLFLEVARRLRDQWGVSGFSGFVWSEHQARAIRESGVHHDSVLVFSRDVLADADDGTPPDLDWLALRERELGVSIHRMIFAERHLVSGRTYEQVMRLVEVALRRIEHALREARPDFVFTEDVSCFHSYAHWAIARQLGIPFWSIGSARLPSRLSVYKSGLQRWESTNARFEQLLRDGLTPEQRELAERYVADFRERPRRPTGMETRSRPPSFSRRDTTLLLTYLRRYVDDRDDPTATPPWLAVGQRIRRIYRQRAAALTDTFDAPVPGERYVLYPIHFQPEASTLVQAPYYLDQLALIADLAKSLPAGVRLYVKEHLSNRGRRPLSFYRTIRETFGVRLLGPDVDTWRLIENAAAIAVITGTMGWEGLIFDKPVIVFGSVFYDVIPGVYRACEVPKDGWATLIAAAVTKHVPRPEALLTYLVALRETSYPGFMKNPNTFPEVLEPHNLDAITSALGLATGLEHGHGR